MIQILLLCPYLHISLSSEIARISYGCCQRCKAHTWIWKCRARFSNCCTSTCIDCNFRRRRIGRICSLHPLRNVACQRQAPSPTVHHFSYFLSICLPELSGSTTPAWTSLSWRRARAKSCPTSFLSSARSAAPIYWSQTCLGEFEISTSQQLAELGSWLPSSSHQDHHRVANLDTVCIPWCQSWATRTASCNPPPRSYIASSLQISLRLLL